jgi:hypothetical protein
MAKSLANVALPASPSIVTARTRAHTRFFLSMSLSVSLRRVVANEERHTKWRLTRSCSGPVTRLRASHCTSRPLRVRRTPKPDAAVLTGEQK